MSHAITKAFLLAAGLGTRLRPLTERVPKCLVPIHGRPLLDIWLDICEELGVREVLINTHHLADEVRSWARSRSSQVTIHLTHEEKLRGSAGTVAANRAFIEREQDFYIFYADNLVRADIRELSLFHLQHPGVLTLGLFRSSRPRDCGIVDLDVSSRIVSFEEKPVAPQSNLANAGIFVARSALFDYITEGQFADFGKDVIPKLIGRIWGKELGGYLLDIGTHENYLRALREWPVIIGRAGIREPATA